MIIFYDPKRVIFGKSEIMYKGKWYLVLYANSDYVIIRLRGKYVKIDKYDVEDCEYNSTFRRYDEKGKLVEVRRRTNSELQEAIREGEMNIAYNYDVDEIDACKQDMELYKSVNFKILFLSGMLTKLHLTSDNTDLYERFNKFVSMIAILPMGDTRRGINICMVDCFEPMYFSSINEILDKYAIYTDRDAIRCLTFKFVIDLLYILEDE